LTPPLDIIVVYALLRLLVIVVILVLRNAITIYPNLL
jgi:hypothetical protein